MIKKLLVLLFLTSLGLNLSAQENREENGMKVGEWAHKDKRGHVYAKGTYKNNLRVGRWHFYISPLARYTQKHDVTGSYNSSGVKEGEWVLTDTKTKIKVIANFTNNLMEGECKYYNSAGDLIARGLMNAGIRHGKWIFYRNNEKMTEGYYQDGIKIDKWKYDYYPTPNTHVKGEFTYTDGKKSGRLEYYRVERHPVFGTDELLSGVGTYTNGRKTGRWIEYSEGLKGQLVETGRYTRNGKRHGYWKTTLGRKNYEAAVYNNGILDGTYKQYHDNGKLKYVTNFENGFEVGEFTRYYSNGNVEEKGTLKLSTNPDDVTRDTTYFVLKLPLEYHFNLVELDFGQLQYHYITWIKDAGWSIPPAELDRRFNLYKDYGKEPHRRYTNIEEHNKKVVRVGEYKAFHKNGTLKLEGEYYPAVTEVFDPETSTVMIDYARDGEWKQYDDNGYLMRTLFYDKGNLIKTLDDKGNETGTSDDSDKEEEEEYNRRVNVHINDGK